MARMELEFVISVTGMMLSCLMYFSSLVNQQILLYVANDFFRALGNTSQHFVVSVPIIIVFRTVPG